MSNTHTHTNTNSTSNISSIFENLKDLPQLNSNKQLIGYFRYLNFYGLLDERGKACLEEINHINLNILQYTGVSLFVSCGVFSYLWKGNKSNMAGLVGMLLNLPAIYKFWENNNQINFLLLLERDRYVPMIEKFFKEDRDPLILNQNFILETVYDPDMSFYQQILRAKILNKH